MKAFSDVYKNELLHEVIPFWEKYSVDRENGGYFTCITDEGKIFDTDKFMWLQARQAWMFSKLYLVVEARESWKDIARCGIDFLKKYGRDDLGNWYFSLTREGKPLVAPYNIFSDCFAAMAFGTYYKVSEDPLCAEVALNTFHNILKRKDNPKGRYNKIMPNTRNMQNFALPMILCNLALELEHILGTDQVDRITGEVVDLIMNHFYLEERGLMLENIGDDGEFVDSFDGRLMNPGHAIEAMWFIMNLGLRKNDQQLVQRAEKIMYQQLEHGWDAEYGGIFYFMDVKGHPPQQLEWDQKLWWVHLETLVALAKVYAWNRSKEAEQWFNRVHQYTWEHFRDKTNRGEWFGYLNRRGEVLLNLKGGKWKGCFHVPRGLLEVWQTLERLR